MYMAQPTKPPSTEKPIIVWFRHDLRVADNPALSAAIAAKRAVIPIFIWAPDEEGDWAPGGASKWWLLGSLPELDRTLRKLGSRLILRLGSTQQVLNELIQKSGAGSVFWNRRYEPFAGERDKQIEASLRKAGIKVETFNGSLLHEPWIIEKKSGGPFQVFTAFWSHCRRLPDPEKPLPSPKSFTGPKSWPRSEKLQTLGLAPIPDWAAGLRETWQPGEAGAAKALNKFLKNAFEDYLTSRNLPALEGTSRLSPYLHFGEISPRQIWHGISRKCDGSARAKNWKNSQFVTELGWREFSHHLLHHFPHTDRGPIRPQFERLRWHKNPEALRAWQRGRTGYPIVDAGMRQLWTTGWMHNRVRMIAASFLVKDLLISWFEGAKWFWDTLVDADLAQNTLGWQWTAGCGADAAPFFRIFNPELQGEKFDPAGDYVRRWIPELRKVSARWIHKPHRAPVEVLEQAGVILGRSYPEPFVSHTTAREVALEAFARLKQ
jgi:deoxyribodipyrimidine photo-lyase